MYYASHKVLASLNTSYYLLLFQSAGVVEYTDYFSAER